MFPADIMGMRKNAMTRTATFADIVDLADRLPLDQKEDLIGLLQRRAIAERRKRIIQQVAASEKEHRSGKSKVGTPDRIMREILG
jgi:hypothetical protein